MRTPKDDDSSRKIALAAEMYYIYDMSQKEIAVRLGVSRPWVSKLLKKAKETDIVRIEINTPVAGTPEMEQKIKDRYRIDHVTVVRPMEEGDYTSISIAAANYLVSHIREDDVIGTSWGISISRMINHVVEMNLPKVSVIPIVGGAGSDVDRLSNSNANKLSRVLGSECKLLHANAYCTDQNEYRVMMSNQMIKDIIEQGEHSDIALVGIGGLENSRVLAYDCVTPEDREKILAADVIGDVAFRFVDKGGEVADLDFNRRVVACDLRTIRANAREVIAIAYGKDKADAIKAVLKGGLLTTFFTDYETAQLLV